MKTDGELLEELERAVKGLLFMSESDYPFQTLFWKDDVELTDAYLRRLAGVDESAPIKTEALEQFFRAAASEPEWKGPEELALARRYQALVAWLKENLDNPQVYRVGQINIQVYVVGKTRTGN